MHGSHSLLASAMAPAEGTEQQPLCRCNCLLVHRSQESAPSKAATGWGMHRAILVSVRAVFVLPVSLMLGCVGRTNLGHASLYYSCTAVPAVRLQVCVHQGYCSQHEGLSIQYENKKTSTWSPSTLHRLMENSVYHLYTASVYLYTKERNHDVRTKSLLSLA